MLLINFLQVGYLDSIKVQFFFSQLILKECVNYGGPMREAMAEILMDKELYSALTERNSDDG